MYGSAFASFFEGLAPSATFAPAGATVGGVALDDLALAALRAFASLAHHLALGLGGGIGGRVWDIGRFEVGRSDAAVGIVGQHLLHNVGYHLLEFIDKLPSGILVAFDFAEFVFPNAGEFGTFQVFFFDEADELYAGGGGFQTFALLADVAAAVKCLDDGSAGGGTADAVFFQHIAQGFIIDVAPGRLHGAKQCGFGVRLGRGGLLLGQGRGVFARFALPKFGEGALFLGACRLGVVIGFVLLEDSAPAGIEDEFAGGAKGDVGRRPIDGGSGKAAVGIEHGDETARHEVVDIALEVGERTRGDTGGDDGVVVGHLGGVKHFFRLLQLRAAERLEEFAVGVGNAVEDGFALGIDIVGQEGGVDAGIGGEFVFVELLNDLQGLFGTVAQLLVALHLQSGEVEEPRWGFRPFLFRHLGHGERCPFDGLQSGLRFLAVGEPSFGSAFLGRSLLIVALHACREGGISIDGGEHPIGLRAEVLDFELAMDDEGQRGGLHAADGEGLCALASVVVAKLQGVEARGVHAQQPVADGTAQPGLVEPLIVGLRTEAGEALTDGLFRHRRNPKALDGALGLRLLEHPSLDEFALLAGITAVDNAVGREEEFFDDAKLLLHSLFKTDAEAGRHHGERSERPGFPVGRVFFRVLEFAKVSEGPRHLVAVAFIVAGIAPHSDVAVGPDDFGNIGGNGRFFGNANYHKSEDEG